MLREVKSDLAINLLRTLVKSPRLHCFHFSLNILENRDNVHTSKIQSRNVDALHLRCK